MTAHRLGGEVAGVIQGAAASDDPDLENLETAFEDPAPTFAMSYNKPEK
jgi:hypothetical protein